MKKKIALVLIMIMVFNTVAWADDLQDKAEGLVTLAWVVGIAAAVGIVALTVFVIVADAEPLEDDGLRLASLQNEYNGRMLTSLQKKESTPENGFASALKVLQHVDLGFTKDNKTYLGFRFQL